MNLFWLPTVTSQRLMVAANGLALLVAAQADATAAQGIRVSRSHRLRTGFSAAASRLAFLIPHGIGFLGACPVTPDRFDGPWSCPGGRVGFGAWRARPAVVLVGDTWAPLAVRVPALLHRV